MAKGTFSYPDADGNTQRIVDPSDYSDYNITIGVGEVDNATDSTANMYTKHNSDGRVELIYPGGQKYSDAVYLCCRFTS